MVGLQPRSRDKRLPLSRRRCKLLALSVVVVSSEVDRLLGKAASTDSPHLSTFKPSVDAHEVGANDEIHLAAHVAPSGQRLLQAAQLLSFALQFTELRW